MPLVFDNVSKVVNGELHIHPTDLELAPGSFNILLGRTGAGKTTLLRLMAGLDRPSGGRISMHGRDVTRLSVRRRNVAMVYQQFVNYPDFTVFDNVASPLKVAGIDQKEINRRVREVAEMMHLGDCLHRLPAELGKMVLDNSKAKARFDWDSKTTLREGVPVEMEWLNEHPGRWKTPHL